MKNYDFQVRIKELRESSGYKSQKAFADVFGVAQSTVAGWESGAREPDFITLKKLSEHFGVSADYLIGCKDAELNKIKNSSKGVYQQLTISDRDLLLAYRDAPQSIKDIVDTALAPYAKHYQKEEAM